MARDHDDEALSWGDENDPTYAAPHPAALDEDDLEEDIPVVDPFSTSAVAPPLPPVPAPPLPPAPAPAPQLQSSAGAAGTAAPLVPSATAAVGGPTLAKAAAAKASPASSGFTSSATGPAASGTAASGTAASGHAPSGTATPGAAASATAVPTVEEQADAAEDAAADADLRKAEKETQQLSSAALITFGIFGGIFLLYTVGWLVTFIRNPTDPSGLAGIVQNAQGILAIAAPALWFIVTLLVAARRKVPVRVIWLVIGVVVLVPWPFLTGN